MAEQKKDIYVKPEKAFAKWNAAKIMNQTVYIYGVSGAGKTAMVRHALAHKKFKYFTMLDGVPEYFNLPKGEKQTIVVLDDLYSIQEEDEQLELEEFIAEYSKRSDVWLILINRARIPSWLMTEYLKQVYVVIEEEDLMLSDENILEYLKAWEIELKEDELNRLLKTCLGNAMAVRLAAIEMHNGHGYSEELERYQSQMWDYLECHVYDQWDVALQDFLMQISIPESFTPQLAEMITGRRDVERMLKIAQETGNFFESTGTVYVYRNAMKLSMRRRMARKYNNEQMSNLYYNAGLYYEIEGDNWNALQMYQKSGNEDRIYSLLVANSRENPASGQYYELRKFYLALPEEKLKKSVDLMTGMSMLQSMLMNIEESECWYQELKKYIETAQGSEKRQAQSQLLYLDIALPHRGSADILDLIKYGASMVTQRKMAIPEFSLTSNLPSIMNGGKDFCEWTKNDKDIANRFGKVIEIVLGKYKKGLVNLSLSESYLEKGYDNYEVSALASRGRMQAEAGGKIEQCFVGIGIHCWLDVLKGHPEEARELLESFQSRVTENNTMGVEKNLNALKCRMYMYEGDTVHIEKWMEEAPNEQEEFFTMERFRYLTKVRVYIMQGQYQRALVLLEKLLYYADINKRTYIAMEVHLLEAIVHSRLGEEIWVKNIQTVISEAESFHFVRLLSREGAAVLSLLKNPKLTWSDSSFKKQVWEETGKIALFYPDYLREKEFLENTFSENALNILRLQADGLTVDEIAQRLFMKKDTVKYHCKENYRKLGVSGKAAAVMEAKKRHLIT